MANVELIALAVLLVTMFSSDPLDLFKTSNDFTLIILAFAALFMFNGI